jgi:hypothetical protein
MTTVTADFWKNEGAEIFAGILLKDDGHGVMSPGPCADAQAEWRRMKAEIGELRALRNAVVLLLDAEHPDHFAARMSDSELLAIDMMKRLVRRL